MRSLDPSSNHTVKLTEFADASITAANDDVQKSDADAPKTFIDVQTADFDPPTTDIVKLTKFADLSMTVADAVI